MEKTTIGKLVKFLGYAQGYLNQSPNERSSLTFALNNHFIRKFKDKIEENRKRLDEKRQELEAQHCSKDKDGNFLESEHQIGGQVIFRKKFTKDAEAKIKEEMTAAEKAVEAEEIEYKFYEVQIPSLIHISWLEPFTGFVFKEMSEDETEKWWIAQGELIEAEAKKKK